MKQDYDHIVKIVDSIILIEQVDAAAKMINLFNLKWQTNSQQELVETIELRGFLKQKIKKINENTFNFNYHEN